MNILVTGGAGYIGSNVARRLIEQGHSVVVYDNLSSGYKEFLPAKGKFVLGDIRDRELPARVMKDNKIEMVMHFAAKTSVPESIQNPLDYFDNNLFGTMNLMQNCVRAQVKKFLFSSTAAVYGDTQKAQVLETDELKPINPYGESKMMSEKIIERTQSAYGMDTTVLRYFNVAGASLDNSLGQKNPKSNHLFHHLTETALGLQEKFSIFGDDFPTADGTGVRDFIHIEDITDAHVRVAQAEFTPAHKIYNCGYGQGFSVLQTLKMMEKVAGHPIPFEIKERRPGDPASVLANSDKIRSQLGWTPKYNDLEIMCRSSLSWKSIYCQDTVKIFKRGQQFVKSQKKIVVLLKLEY